MKPNAKCEVDKVRVGSYLCWIAAVAAVCKQTRNALPDRRGVYCAGKRENVIDLL